MRILPNRTCRRALRRADGEKMAAEGEKMACFDGQNYSPRDREGLASDLLVLWVESGRRKCGKGS